MKQGAHVTKKVQGDAAALQALAVISGRRGSMPIGQIVDRVQQSKPNFTDADVKAALWLLHSLGLIVVTPDWMVRQR